MKRTLSILGIALGLAGLLYLSGPRGDSRQALEPLNREQTAPNDEEFSIARRKTEVTGEAEERELAEDRVALVSPSEAQRTERGATQSRSAAKASPILVEGRVGAAEYGSGSTRWDESGLLTLLLHPGSPSDRVRELEVRVEAGRFQFTQRADARIQIKDLRLDDRFVVLQPEFLGIALPASFPARIEGEWAGQTILRVFDKGSGRELPTIHVRQRMNFGVHLSSPTDFPPAEGTPHLARNEPTPFVLNTQILVNAQNRPTQASTFPLLTWVGAPKHAWQRVDVDPLAGGERRIYLPRAASLRVQIDGDRSLLIPSDPVYLRLRRPGQRSYTSALWKRRLASEDTEVPTPPLPVGTWRLSLERGPAFGPEVLAEETVKVLFSDEGRIVPLELPSNRGREGEALLEGEVVLHPSFDPMILTVRAVALDVESVTSGDEHARFTCQAGGGTEVPYRFSLPTGRWRVHLEPLGLTREVDLYPSGQSGVDFNPQAPARVEVRVRSKANGETLAPGQIRWRSGSGTGVAAVVRANEDEPGFYEFQTLPGDLELRCALRGYRYLAKDVQVSSGTNVFVLELDRDCSVQIQLLDGETRIPWTRKHLASALALEGEGRLFGASGESVLFTDEGEYELRFEGLDGFRDPDPIRVRIDCVERERVEVSLDREF